MKTWENIYRTKTHYYSGMPWFCTYSSICLWTAFTFICRCFKFLPADVLKLSVYCRCSELLFFYLRTFLSFPFYLRMFLTFISTCRCFKLSVYCRCSKLLFLPADVLKLSVYCRCFNFNFCLRTFLNCPFIADVRTFCFYLQTCLSLQLCFKVYMLSWRVGIDNTFLLTNSLKCELLRTHGGPYASIENNA